jgi:hypothetical protein
MTRGRYEGREDVRTGFWWENPKGRETLENPYLEGMLLQIYVA